MLGWVRALTVVPILTILATSSFAGGYVEALANAEPAAAALLHSKAKDLAASSDIVKDRAGFMLFEQEFEGKKRMSIQDVIDCLNRDAPLADPGTAMINLVNGCVAKIDETAKATAQKRLAENSFSQSDAEKAEIALRAGISDGEKVERIWLDSSRPNGFVALTNKAGKLYLRWVNKDGSDLDERSLMREVKSSGGKGRRLEAIQSEGKYGTFKSDGKDGDLLAIEIDRAGNVSVYGEEDAHLGAKPWMVGKPWKTFHQASGKK